MPLDSPPFYNYPLPFTGGDIGEGKDVKKDTLWAG